MTICIFIQQKQRQYVSLEFGTLETSHSHIHYPIAQYDVSIALPRLKSIIVK